MKEGLEKITQTETSCSVLLTKYNSGDQNTNGMGGACGTYGGEGP